MRTRGCSTETSTATATPLFAVGNEGQSNLSKTTSTSPPNCNMDDVTPTTKDNIVIKSEPPFFLEIDTSMTYMDTNSSDSPTSIPTSDCADTPSTETDEEPILEPLGSRRVTFKCESDDEDPMRGIDEYPSLRDFGKSLTSPLDHGLRAAQFIGRVSLSTSPTSPAESDLLATQKRRRGRPRKGGPVSPKPVKPHGRSKTGCLTCRRRKKKCDERKPGCANCERTHVECEGYPELKTWKPGKQTSQSDKEPNLRLVITDLPAQVRHIIPGLDLDGELDLLFLSHFVTKVSMVLTIRENEETNPFVELMVPMAVNHKGLMHSLLALSGSHLNKCVPKAEYEERKTEHFSKAISALVKEVAAARAKNADVEDPIVACMIMQCLIPISEGTTDGEYAAHLTAAGGYIKYQEDNKFSQFAWEFYKYHDMSTAMTRLKPIAAMKNDEEQHVPSAYFPGVHHRPNGVMIGVLDGLFKYITQITAIRDRVRQRKQNSQDPSVEYPKILEANTIGKNLLEWNSGQEEFTPRWVAAELYREAILVYLHRSIRASKADPDLSSRVDRGIRYFEALPGDNSTQCILLLPVFILACAAFEPKQRESIKKAFNTLETYSRLGNISPTRDIVNRVWTLMDAGDERSWDWESIMRDMNYDLLIT